jgi:hypothetical protein
MKRFAAIALVVAGLVVPAFAQRGMSRGGFSGHSAGAFHGGFASPHFGFSAPHFSGGFAASRGYGFAGGLRYPARSFTRYSSTAYPASGFRAPYMGADFRGRRSRRPYFSGYGYGAPVFYTLPEGIGLGPLGYYPDGFGYDDSAASSNDVSGDNGSQGYEQPAEPEQPVYRGGYEPSDYMPPPAPVPESENATTIIFKDGRPSEQIHNYALTRTTLYVLDQQHRDIPLDQLDVAATEKANRAAGIEFQVPQLP